jgi:hypothetical protein
MTKDIDWKKKNESDQLIDIIHECFFKFNLNPFIFKRRKKIPVQFKIIKLFIFLSTKKSRGK